MFMLYFVRFFKLFCLNPTKINKYHYEFISRPEISTCCCLKCSSSVQSIKRNTRIFVLRSFVIPFLFSASLRGTPWIMKRGGLEGSGKTFISLNGKTKGINFLLFVKKNKKKNNKLDQIF